MPDSGSIGNNTSANDATTSDYQHSLFLYPSNAPGSLTIPIMLTESDNYTLWSRDVKLTLLGRNNMGSVKHNQFTCDLAELWD
ncbi:hypothetical protein KY290_033783 [Solanum tuberosum]|uniref:Retrotransposon Copia-like N-terminal domain-containing protein n=1 Tax=Solanum tuberosum TaxID=4113 RepID=A0ABQ7U1I8_SOLTU|nr:hypothetical protein KY290_033783 [Solanum tuberosum]